MLPQSCKLLVAMKVADVITCKIKNFYLPMHLHEVIFAKGGNYETHPVLSHP